jgi:methylthioxylose transferase
MPTAPAPSTAAPATAADAVVSRWATGGLVVGAVVLTAAMTVPWLTGVDVEAGGAPPLLGDWMLRYAPSSLVAVVLVASAVVPAVRDRVRRMSWGSLLGLAWVAAASWMVSLALVDGVEGLGTILDHGTEYLQSARAADDAGALLRTYVDRIPLDSADNLPVHLAGHPPGAVLVFVGLVRLGLESWLAVGLVVVAVAATVPAAVAVTLDRLGARAAARTALPFLVLAPSAIFMAVSADAVFAATAAWGTAALAAAGAASRPVARWGLAVLAGLLLGWCLMESYGLVLLALLAVAVLLASPGSWRRRAATATVTAGVALLVVLAFVPLGFAWWEAYPVLHERYWAGLADRRPGWYWVFGNLGALLLCAGPMLAAGLGAGAARLPRLRRPRPGDLADPVAALVLAAVAMVAVADLSLMSKAEVERIWLPFVPWLLLSTVWLPPRWHRWGLVAQGVTALLVAHLVHTVW